MTRRLLDEEVKNLVLQAQQGNEGKLNELYDAFFVFRDNLTRNYYGKGVDMDDIAQEVDYSFIVSVLGYDSSRSDSPTLHITSRTKRMVSNYYNGEVRYQRSIIPTGGVSVTMETAFVDDEYFDLQQRLVGLSEFEKQAVYFYFFMDLTQEETAKELGVSRMKIQRILAKLK